MCNNEIFATLLIINGLLAYVVIQSKYKLAKKIKKINADLYRAILFPELETYEADYTSITTLIFYPKFKKAIKSDDFNELKPLKLEITKISTYTLSLLASSIASLLWILRCT